eukprot:COSAG01_NODE_4050_length_5401_cov_4.215956_3_plen_136_part_00
MTLPNHALTDSSMPVGLCCLRQDVPDFEDTPDLDADDHYDGAKPEQPQPPAQRRRPATANPRTRTHPRPLASSSSSSSTPGATDDDALLYRGDTFSSIRSESMGGGGSSSWPVGQLSDALSAFSSTPTPETMLMA